MAALGILGGIIFLIVGVVQIYVGYLGIEYHFGEAWAIGAIVVFFFLRINFPLTIGTFFGALDVWGWPWYGAAALAAPGLLFVVPALVTAAIGTLFQKKPEYQYTTPSEPIYESPIKDVTPVKKKKKAVKKRTKKIVKKKSK